MKSYSLAATLHKSFKSSVTQSSYLSEDLNKIQEMTEKEDFCVHFLSIFYLSTLSSSHSTSSLHLVLPLGHKEVFLACGRHTEFHTCCTQDNSQSCPHHFPHAGIKVIVEHSLAYKAASSIP